MGTCSWRSSTLVSCSVPCAVQSRYQARFAQCSHGAPCSHGTEHDLRHAVLAPCSHARYRDCTARVEGAFETPLFEVLSGLYLERSL